MPSFYTVVGVLAAILVTSRIRKVCMACPAMVSVLDSKWRWAISKLGRKMSYQFAGSLYTVKSG